MRNRLHHGQPSHYRSLYLATLAALFGSGIVSAADTAPVTAGDSGLMHFPNVRVEHAPQPAASGTAAVREAGLRAYRDRETRQLRAPLPEELARERARARPTISGQQHQDVRDRMIISPDGAIGYKLDQSHEVFTVVRRQPNGQLEEFCVVGPDSAQKLLDARTPAKKSPTPGRYRDER
jgi:hypothetical protein